MSWTQAAGALLMVASLLAGGAGGQEALRSPFAVAPPEIDGVVGEGEWRAAERLTLPSRDGGTQCIFLLMNDSERLYIGVDAIHDTTNTTASSHPYGGFDNMAIWFKGEVGYWMRATARVGTMPRRGPSMMTMKHVRDWLATVAAGIGVVTPALLYPKTASAQPSSPPPEVVRLAGTFIDALNRRDGRLRASPYVVRAGLMAPYNIADPEVRALVEKRDTAALEQMLLDRALIVPIIHYVSQR
ncbi:MAG: hypothetical protein QN131_09055 [Armatimonadota bacterium]|nr:hypothetical protein [Armatimonadota bacterium]MDR7550067.1 hypothetical protein [Armatimonadota bacterium]